MTTTTKKATRFVLNHRDNSRKSRVHVMFDTKGDDIARKYARRLKLRDTTINSWFSQFRKQSRVLNAIAKRDAKRVAKNDVIENVAS